jgi:DNA-binding LytR/AlgR family response regulator
LNESYKKDKSVSKLEESFNAELIKPSANSTVNQTSFISATDNESSVYVSMSEAEAEKTSEKSVNVSTKSNKSEKVYEKQTVHLNIYLDILKDQFSQIHRQVKELNSEVSSFAHIVSGLKCNRQ